MSEDIVQEVFLKVLKKASSFRGEGSCKAWIFNIARNVTFDYLRKADHQTESADPGESDERLIDHRSTEQVAAAKQNLKLVEQALTEIPAAAREVNVTLRAILNIQALQLPSPRKLDAFFRILRNTSCTMSSLTARLRVSCRQY